jgi:hypothetical protein
MFNTFFSTNKQFGGAASSPTAAWVEISQEKIDHLVRAMPWRVMKCIANYGESTYY